MGMNRFLVGLSWTAVIASSSPASTMEYKNQTTINLPPLNINSDIEVASRISRKLFKSKNFSPENIYISSKSGTVTLSGDVSNLRSKNRAVEYAEGTSGVTAVVDEIKIKPPPRSDEIVLKEIKRILTIDPAMGIFNLDVSVSRGTVTLKGKVDSWSAKNLASWVVSGVNGVVEVRGELKILRQKKVSDDEIANDVRDELKADPFIDDKLIEVKVKESVVTLLGKVPSLLQRNRVYRDAFVASVVDVDSSQIRIDPEMPNLGPTVNAPDDVQIQTSALKALKLDPRLKRANIYIDVNDHSATLSGTVESLKSKMTAEEDAENTVGVADVDNQLFVDPWQKQTNQK